MEQMKELIKLLEYKTMKLKKEMENDKFFKEKILPVVGKYKK